jgi:hypothetical protein
MDSVKENLLVHPAQQALRLYPGMDALLGLATAPGIENADDDGGVGVPDGLYEGVAIVSTYRNGLVEPVAGKIPRRRCDTH